MKIIKTALNKTRISLTRDEWIAIGKQKGWAKTAQYNNFPHKAEEEKNISFVVKVDPQITQEFGKVFYDSDFELGLSMDKNQAKLVYDILQNKAQSQEGEMSINIVGEAHWNEETFVPYQETEIGLNDSGWESNSVNISSIELYYIDRITQKKVQVNLPDSFIQSAEEALKEYLENTSKEMDFGLSPKERNNEITEY